MKWGVRRARQNKSSANNPRKKSSKKEARTYESKVFTDKYGKIHKKYDPDIQDTIKKIVKVNAQDISQNGYKNIHDDMMKTYMKEDFSRYMSKNPSLSGGKVSTNKERKRLGISKENEEKMIKDIAREEANQNNNFLSYYDVKASLKDNYRDLIELEEMDNW